MWYLGRGARVVMVGVGAPAAAAAGGAPRGGQKKPQALCAARVWIIIIYKLYNIIIFYDADKPYHDSRDSRLQSGTAEQIIKSGSEIR